MRAESKFLLCKEYDGRLQNCLRKDRWIKEGLFFEVIIFTLIKTLQITQKNEIEPAITCSKLIIETLEQGVKYVQS